MPDYDVTYMEKLTKLTTNDCPRLLRYFAGLPVSLCLRVTERQRQISTQWKNEYHRLKKEQQRPTGWLKRYNPDRGAENFLAGLLVAANEVHRLEFIVHRGRNLSEEEMALCRWIREERQAQETAKRLASDKTRHIIENYEMITELLERRTSYEKMTLLPLFNGFSKQWINKIYRAERDRRAALSELAV
jgi:hypothetical protein